MTEETLALEAIRKKLFVKDSIMKRSAVMDAIGHDRCPRFSQPILLLRILKRFLQ